MLVVTVNAYDEWVTAMVSLANIEAPRSGIAQLVEQRPVKAMVGGSSPPAGAESLSKGSFSRSRTRIRA